MDWRQSERLYLDFGTGDAGEPSELYAADMTLVDQQYIHIGQLTNTQQQKRAVEQGQLVSGFITLTDGTKHYFDSEITHYDAGAETAILRRPLDNELTITPRRQYLRVKASIEVAVKQGEHRFTAMTSEVSAGNLVLLLEKGHQLRSGDELECWLLIHMKNGAIEHVPLEAVVLHAGDGKQESPRCRIEYTLLAEPDRQKLIRYCFERQFDFRNP